MLGSFVLSFLFVGFGGGLVSGSAPKPTSHPDTLRRRSPSNLSHPRPAKMWSSWMSGPEETGPWPGFLDELETPKQVSDFVKVAAAALADVSRLLRSTGARSSIPIFIKSSSSSSSSLHQHHDQRLTKRKKQQKNGKILEQSRDIMCNYACWMMGKRLQKDQENQQESRHAKRLSNCPVQQQRPFHTSDNATWRREEDGTKISFVSIDWIKSTMRSKSCIKSTRLPFRSPTETLWLSDADM